MWAAVAWARTSTYSSQVRYIDFIKIIKILGNPTKEQILDMNKNYTEFKFPAVQKHTWEDMFPKHSPQLIDLLDKMLRYSPQERIEPLKALKHPFFDELREQKTSLPKGGPLPPLFNFTAPEILLDRELVASLIPAHARTIDNWPLERVLDNAKADGTYPSNICRLHHPQLGKSTDNHVDTA